MRKRKKNSRMRGGTTHGYGSMKKHRGSGNRGGKGHGGSGKRGDAKKPNHWSNVSYFGKFGFKHSPRLVASINVGALDLLLVNLLDSKKISKENDLFTINLASLGYTKLLGAGQVAHKMKISVKHSSARAMEKVKKAGGEVINVGV